MIFDQQDMKESQTIEALVPMVDLFAVLAIVFMIYASDEITITELTTATKMQEIVETIDEMKQVVESIEKDSQERIAEVERESEERIKEILDQYENDPKFVLAKEADKTLEEIKEARRKKAEELVMAFTAMLEAQQDQSADEYEEVPELKKRRPAEDDEYDSVPKKRTAEAPAKKRPSADELKKVL